MTNPNSGLIGGMVGGMVGGLVASVGGVAAAQVAIVNPSFESPQVAVLSLDVDGWDKAGPEGSQTIPGIGTFDGLIDTGVFLNLLFDPDTFETFSKPGGDGTQAAFLVNRPSADPPISLTQTLAEPVAPGVTYTLTAGLGTSDSDLRPPIVADSAMRMVLLAAGSDVLDEVASRTVRGSELTSLAFTDLSLAFGPVGAGDPAVGRQLAIRFEPVEVVPGLAEGGAFEIDNVRLVATAGCAADRDGDGDADVFDILAYFASFGAAEPSADLDGNGLFDIFDVLGYFDLFAAGC